MAPSAAWLPDCGECEKAPPKERRLDRIAKLGMAELQEYEAEIERIDKSGVRHAVDIADLVGEYESEEWQHCSYFEHAHKNGLLIFARCGVLLAIGMDCGRKNVSGFGKVERHVAVIRKIETERSLHETEPQRLLESLGVLAGRVERRLNGLEVLRRVVPKVHDAMRKAHLYSDHGVQVRVERTDRETLAKRYEYEQRLLRGLKLFGGIVSGERLREILGRAESFARNAQTIEIGWENYERVASERRALKDQEGELQQWLEETAKFWTEENLALALLKAYGERVPEGLKVKGGRILVSGGSAVAVGIEGEAPAEMV
jgi:hypothetical protein